MAQENEKQRRFSITFHIVIAICAAIAVAELRIIFRPGKAIENYMKDMRKNPPTCIEPLSCEPERLLEKLLMKNYGDYTSVFGLKCSCRAEEFYIKGKDIQPRYEGIVGPISVTCKACGKQVTVFDPNKHGYDAELGSGYDNKELPEKIVKCPKCGADVFRLALAFQYSGDEKQIIEEDHLNKKPQDLFGWFSGEAFCQSCGHIFEFASIECQ